MTNGRGVSRLVYAMERGVAIFSGWLQDNAPVLMFAAFGLLFVVVGALLIWAAFLRRAENAAYRARGENLNRRNASPGCLIAVGVPLVLLGLVVLGSLWYVFASADIPPSGGMPV